MATQQEATDYVLKVNETLAKVNNETTTLVATNKKLQEELAAAGGAGGIITPELEAAIRANGTSVDAIDGLVTDVPQPEKAKK
jgi:hypothetical protein